MLALLRKLAEISTQRERRRFAGLLVAFFWMGVLEVVGIASIMPFMQLVANPEVISSNELLNWGYETFKFDSETSFLFVVGSIVLALLTVSNLSNIAVTWFQEKFVWTTVHGLGQKLLGGYLHQPYSYFLRKNSADLIHRVLSEVDTFAASVLLPLVRLISKLSVAILIFALLLAVDPVVAIVVFSVLGGGFALIFLPIKSYLSRLGETRFETNRMRFRSATESLSNVKLAKTRDCEGFFLNRFVNASRRYTQIQPRFGVIATSPRHLIQIVTFGVVIGMLLVFLADGRDVGEVLPIMSLYVIAGYRLTPSLGQVFTSLTSLRFNAPVVDELAKDLRLAAPPSTHTTSPVGRLALDDEIRVENLSYQYPESDEVVLRDVSLTIPRLSSVGFVGPTGSGKTTLVDCIVGLLEPSSGRVLVDGVPLTPANSKAWIRSVGYVPQTVELYDDSILRNVALGAADDEVDVERVNWAAHVASLSEFIESLPDGFDTAVGENGVRLSGGQRQRIGLARALYHRPDILVLDEATSALDGITEDAVMRAIALVGGELTIIMIAHRATTVRECDQIFIVRDGGIAEEGNYDSLMSDSLLFRNLAKAGDFEALPGMKD